MADGRASAALRLVVGLTEWGLAGRCDMMVTRPVALICAAEQCWPACSLVHSHGWVVARQWADDYTTLVGSVVMLCLPAR